MQELYRKINSQLSKIERKLLSLLKRFYNKYIRGSINPVDIVRQQRGGYIYNLLKKAIVDAGFLGNTYAMDVVMQNNIKLILDLVDKQYNQFWKTVSKLRMREDELKTINPDKIIEPGVIPEPVYKPALDIDASLLGFVGWVSLAAFNSTMVGILLLTDPGDRPSVIFMTVGDKKVDKKICRPLHGRTFNVNDINLPRPPMHLFCRCMLLPSI